MEEEYFTETVSDNDLTVSGNDIIQNVDIEPIVLNLETMSELTQNIYDKMCETEIPILQKSPDELNNTEILLLGIFVILLIMIIRDVIGGIFS